MSEELPAYEDSAHEYDAVLVVSFGGPEGPADVEPFLDNVLRGLPIRPESRAEIVERYQQFGGVSPINAHTRAFIEALKRELDTNGPALPVYWGNRNWHPLLSDTFRQMERDGVRSVAAYVTSTFSSYSGCRKYREDLYEAAAGLERPPRVDKLRVGFNHPGFVNAVADRVREARARIPEGRRELAPLLFTAHSLPESMARNARYETQLAESCRLVADALEVSRWQLVFQSNNARYGGEPWLGPDVGEAIEAVRTEGAEDVVVVPIGFVCDHMEVIHDLDVEAARRAREAGIRMIRAGTVGSHPDYVAMVRELVLERMHANPKRRALGTLGASHDRCAPDCCLSGRPGAPKPTLAGVDDALLTAT